MLFEKICELHGEEVKISTFEFERSESNLMDDFERLRTSGEEATANVVESQKC